MLYAGSYSFATISLSKTLALQHLVWQNGYLLAQGETSNRKPEEFFQISISGSNGTVTGPVDLDGRKNKHPSYEVEFAVDQGTIVQPYGAVPSYLNYWRYPAGGNPYKTITVKDHSLRKRTNFIAVTISLAPSR